MLKFGFFCIVFAMINGFLLSQPEADNTILVIDARSGAPISGVHVSSFSMEFTITNDDGVCTFYRASEKDSVFTLDAVGYLPYMGKLDSVISLMPCDIIKENLDSVSGRYLVETSLSKIADNYPRDNNFYYGFYNESIFSGQDLFAFSEGIVQSFKRPYANNFDFDNCYQTLRQDAAILSKGNTRTNIQTQLNFPASEDGYLLPKTIDPLSICSSPLMKENLEYFNFQFESTLMESPENINVISFENDFSGINGLIYIGKESHAIYRIEVREEHTTETLSNEIMATASNYSVDYIQNEHIFVLGKIQFAQNFINKKSGDTIKSITNYVTTRWPIKLDSLPSRVEVLQKNNIPENYLPVNPQERFYATQVISRTNQVETQIGEGQSINFYSSDLEELIRKSQEENKLVFIYIFGSDDGPSVRMNSTTLKNQKLVSYINEHFTAGSIDLSKDENHDIVYMAELEFLPSYLIMTPLGQIIQVFDGYMTPESLVETLESYEGFNVNKLFYAYDKRKGSERKKIQSAYLDLFRQLRSMNHPEAANFVSFFEDETKNWNTYEAKDVVFQYLTPSEEKKYQRIVLENLDYFEQKFGKKAVADRLYEMAFNYLIEKDINNHKKFAEFLEKNAPAFKDSLNGYFLIDYFSNIRVNPPAYMVAVLEYFDKYHEHNWPMASRHLMTLGVIAENPGTINRAMEVLSYYEGKVTNYEYLDVLSLLKYKAGQEEEALGMIEEIMRLARQKGVDYKIALRQLSNANK